MFIWILFAAQVLYFSIEGIFTANTVTEGSVDDSPIKELVALWTTTNDNDEEAQYPSVSHRGHFTTVLSIGDRPP